MDKKVLQVDLVKNNEIKEPTKPSNDYLICPKCGNRTSNYLDAGNFQAHCNKCGNIGIIEKHYNIQSSIESIHDKKPPPIFHQTNNDTQAHSTKKYLWHRLVSRIIDIYLGTLI